MRANLLRGGVGVCTFMFIIMMVVGCPGKKQVTPIDEPSPLVSQPSEEQPSSPERVSLGKTDQPNFESDYYLRLVKAILGRAWNPPESGDKTYQTRVHMVILRDGTIINPEVTQPSGWDLHDRSALEAVLSVGKLPPLPKAYEGDDLGVTVNFKRSDTEP